MTKYKETFLKMLADNKNLFDEFKKVHDEYALNQKNQEELNSLGEKVMNLVRLYEDKLCGRSEGTGYASFTGNLAEKFQTEVRKAFPKIDYVGVKIKPASASFELRKINL